MILKKLLIHFGADVQLLHVTTPNSTEDMKHVSKKLQRLQSSYIESENATTFQGVLDHTTLTFDRTLDHTVSHLLKVISSVHLADLRPPSLSPTSAH